MEHDLRCWPEHYAAIDGGRKTCELRLNDRPYAVGDSLLLQEYEPLESRHTGASVRVRVTHILASGVWLAPGYIAMSIRLMGEDGQARVQKDWKGVADQQRKTLDDAIGYLTRLLLSIEPGIIPFPDLPGLTTQVDHLLAAAYARIDNLRSGYKEAVNDAAADQQKLGIAERMARYLGWAFEHKLIIKSETAELLDQVLREWKAGVSDEDALLKEAS